MIIRQERLEDYDEVYHVVKEAFKSAEHSDGNEQDLVVELRKSKSFNVHHNGCKCNSNIIRFYISKTCG